MYMYTVYAYKGMYLYICVQEPTYNEQTISDVTDELFPRKLVHMLNCLQCVCVYVRTNFDLSNSEQHESVHDSRAHEIPIYTGGGDQITQVAS